MAVKFQQSQALTSHFESFWSIVHCKWLRFQAVLIFARRIPIMDVKEAIFPLRLIELVIMTNTAEIF